MENWNFVWKKGWSLVVIFFLCVIRRHWTKHLIGSMNISSNLDTDPRHGMQFIRLNKKKIVIDFFKLVEYVEIFFSLPRNF